MKIIERKFKGVYEITLEPNIDERGFFMRTFDEKIFKEARINRKWVQENHARSESKGIIRGLHFQFPPYSETKLVRVIIGAILDVFVDLRKDSATFGQWDAVQLSAENRKMILIPRGFAHGYCTLTKVSEVLYKADNYYAPDYEGGIIWNDSELNIEWPVIDAVLSSKDKKNMTLSEFIEKHKGIIEK